MTQEELILNYAELKKENARLRDEINTQRRFCKMQFKLMKVEHAEHCLRLDNDDLVLVNVETNEVIPYKPMSIEDFSKFYNGKLKELIEN